MVELASLVLPGQDVSVLVTQHLESVRPMLRKSASPDDTLPVRLGFGLQHDPASDRFVALATGPLLFGAPCRFWVGCRRTRYAPCVGDLVLGVAVAKNADVLRLDICAHQPAVLHAADGFSAASRRNRPNVPLGGVVFARVTLAHRDLEGAELSCIEDPGSSAGGQECLGYIKPAPTTCTFDVHSVSYTLDLQRPDNAVLAAFGQFFAFEIVVGANGRFVVTTGDAQLTWLLGRAIVAAEHCGSAEHIDRECRKIASLLSRKPN